MKILIHGGRVIDPANAVDSRLNLLLTDGKIAAVTRDLPEAELVIDATGKIVCPGFLDIHMHEDPVGPDGKIVLDEETAIYHCMLRMGVTTAIGGNCGENKYHPADYLDLVDRDGAPVNVGMLAGHEFFRVQAGCTDKYAPTTAAQRAQMAREVEESLRRGCLGVSFGIRYVPGMDARELIETAAGCKRYGRMIAAHIRSDAEEVFDAAREFLDAGEALGVPVEISHIGSMAGFGQMERFLTLVDSYRLRNLKIGCDCYPYDAFSTGIGSTTYDDGWMERYHCGYDVVELAEGKYKGQRCTRETFEETRRDFPACMTVCYVMQQEDVDIAFRHPGVMLGSDGTLSQGQGHPRAAGAFPRLLGSYVRSGKVPLYHAVDMITAMPARQLGLSGKGRLNVGADADVVIFDPATVEDRATFAQPLLPPKGIEWVIVGGVPAAREGRVLDGRAGKSVRCFTVE